VTFIFIACTHVVEESRNRPSGLPGSLGIYIKAVPGKNLQSASVKLRGAHEEQAQYTTLIFVSFAQSLQDTEAGGAYMTATTDVVKLDGHDVKRPGIERSELHRPPTNQRAK
jgi:hypothetical protein